MRFDALGAGPADGELVLLLHGFPQTAACWRAALSTLGAAGYRAVAVSQRGYSAGAMPAGIDAYGIDELTADVLAFAEALGRERFHLIGHDWGATVAWSVAAQHPASLHTLTAISTPHSAALREALEGTRQRLQMSYVSVIRLPNAAEWLVDAAGGAILETMLVATGLGRAHARRDVAALRRLGPTGALNWYRAIGRGSRAAAGPVAVSTLHVWGDHDLAFTRAATELTEQHVTGPYHLVELTGASHWIPDEHWEDIEDLVLEHLAGAAG
jgi:pimeloyl-ACP methyl ester carboxylesterase